MRDMNRNPPRRPNWWVRTDPSSAISKHAHGDGRRPLPPMSQELSDELDALEEEGSGEISRADRLQEMMEDMDDPDTVAHAHRHELRRLGVAMGIWREISREEMDSTYTASTRGGRTKKYDFKIGTRHYMFESWNPLISYGLTFWRL